MYLPGDRAFKTEAGQFDHLYRNDGERFHGNHQNGRHRRRRISRCRPPGGITTTTAFPDLYAANDFYGPDRLYHNNGDGTFTDVAKDCCLTRRGSRWGPIWPM